MPRSQLVERTRPRHRGARSLSPNCVTPSGIEESLDIRRAPILRCDHCSDIEVNDFRLSIPFQQQRANSTARRCFASMPCRTSAGLTVDRRIRLEAEPDSARLHDRPSAAIARRHTSVHSRGNLFRKSSAHITLRSQRRDHVASIRRRTRCPQVHFSLRSPHSVKASCPECPGCRLDDRRVMPHGWPSSSAVNRVSASRVDGTSVLELWISIPRAPTRHDN
jgi:hypothetical protein